MSKEIEITESELFAEIEKLRETETIQGMPDLQFECMKKARDNPKPINFKKLAIFWEKQGWGKISSEALCNKYRRELYKRELR